MAKTPWMVTLTAPVWGKPEVGAILPPAASHKDREVAA